LTEGEQHWRKQVITFFGCTANLMLAVAGASLAAAMGVRTSDSKSLIPPLVCVAFQAYVSLLPLLAAREPTGTSPCMPPHKTPN
jgi:hypothetical protein